MLLAPHRQVRRSHRSIHCWHGHAACRSALPRAWFSPLGLKRTSPSSGLLDDLCAVGCDVRDDGEGERILPSAIVQKFVAGPDGELVPLTEGPTRPVTSIVTHPGIARVLRYTLV